jgi:hypothetical protein
VAILENASHSNVPFGAYPAVTPWMYPPGRLGPPGPVTTVVPSGSTSTPREQQLEFEFQFGLEFQLRFGLEFEFVVEQLDEGRTRRRCTGSGAVGLRVASAAIRP